MTASTREPQDLDHLTDDELADLQAQLAKELTRPDDEATRPAITDDIERVVTEVSRRHETA